MDPVSKLCPPQLVEEIFANNRLSHHLDLRFPPARFHIRLRTASPAQKSCQAARPTGVGQVQKFSRNSWRRMRRRVQLGSPSHRIQLRIALLLSCSNRHHRHTGGGNLSQPDKHASAFPDSDFFCTLKNRRNGSPCRYRSAARPLSDFGDPIAQKRSRKTRTTRARL